jgi:transcription antitermination factor NusG
MAERWYAVYTKPRWEKKVADTLTTQGIHNYCPLNRVVRQWSDRKKTVQQPLFTSYVFVYVQEKQFVQLKKLDGILHLVCWLGKPAIIKEEEIEVIRHFLREHRQVRLEKAHIRLHDTIQITNGSFAHQQGTIVGFQNNSIKVALPSLGYFMYAVLDSSSVEKVKQ